MVTTPATFAGVLAVIDVDETKTTLVAAVPPKVKVTPLENPLPVIVTEVPPANAPRRGEIEVTDGAGAAKAGGAKIAPVKLLRKMAEIAIALNLFRCFMKSKPHLAIALTANVIDSLKLTE